MGCEGVIRGTRDRTENSCPVIDQVDDHDPGLALVDAHPKSARVGVHGLGTPQVGRAPRIPNAWSGPKLPWLSQLSSGRFASGELSRNDAKSAALISSFTWMKSSKPFSRCTPSSRAASGMWTGNSAFNDAMLAGGSGSVQRTQPSLQYASAEQRAQLTIRDGTEYTVLPSPAFTSGIRRARSPPRLRQLAAYAHHCSWKSHSPNP